MARYKSRNYKGNSDPISSGLTQLVSMVILLFVFDGLLDSVMPTVQNSSWFGTGISLVESLIPIFGILGGYFIIRKTLKQVNQG